VLASKAETVSREAEAALAELLARQAAMRAERRVADAALEVARGRHGGQFPLDVYQTGSGTSTNMNANEVIARLAGQALGKPVHANDHVNMCQSSNDCIPSAIHVSAVLVTRRELLPALEGLQAVLGDKERAWRDVIKTGRTHLMDATPLTLGQEVSGWRAQIGAAMARLKSSEPRLLALAQGGTAVGTGINAHAEFAPQIDDLDCTHANCGSAVSRGMSRQR